MWDFVIKVLTMAWQLTLAIVGFIVLGLVLLWMSLANLLSWIWCSAPDWAQTGPCTAPIMDWFQSYIIWVMAAPLGALLLWLLWTMLVAIVKGIRSGWRRSPVMTVLGCSLGLLFCVGSGSLVTGLYLAWSEAQVAKHQIQTVHTETPTVKDLAPVQTERERLLEYAEMMLQKDREASNESQDARLAVH